jgi:hypothetical protein
MLLIVSGLLLLLLVLAQERHCASPLPFICALLMADEAAVIYRDEELPASLISAPGARLVRSRLVLHFPTHPAARAAWARALLVEEKKKEEEIESDGLQRPPRPSAAHRSAVLEATLQMLGEATRVGASPRHRASSCPYSIVTHSRHWRHKSSTYPPSFTFHISEMFSCLHHFQFATRPCCPPCQRNTLEKRNSFSQPLRRGSWVHGGGSADVFLALCFFGFICIFAWQSAADGGPADWAALAELQLRLGRLQDCLSTVEKVRGAQQHMRVHWHLRA